MSKELDTDYTDKISPSMVEEMPEDELEDGLEEDEPEEHFYKNLAEDMSESVNDKISSSLLESIAEDIDARQDWMDSVNKVKKYLGFTLEDLENLPFKDAHRTYDTTLSTALIRFFATTRSELLPESGPVGFKVLGKEEDFLKEKGQLVTDWMNYFLTTKDKSYYQDFDKLLLYVGLYGSAFKKVYYDNLSQQPLSRFILPQNFIVDGDCPSVNDSTRITHVLHLSKREILINQERGVYSDIDLPYLRHGEKDALGNTDDQEKQTDDINVESYSKRSLFPIYEVHTFLSLDSFIDNENGKDDIPLPYIITIDQTTKKILSIRRNWNSKDNDRERANYFIQYNYLPGFGIYGLGLAHLAGTNAITLTKILRQQLDAASLHNFPGGVRTKPWKGTESTSTVAFGEFVEIDTGGTPIQESFMQLPVRSPSETSRQLRMDVIEQTKEQCSTSEMGMLESKEDIATGTVLAMLETNNKIQSTVLRGIHHSFTQELQLLHGLFKENLTYEQFSQESHNQSITDEDFVDGFRIIPISDPAVNSNIQKIIRAQMLLATAEKFPNFHNMRNALENFYQAHGLEEGKIEEVLIPDPLKQEDPRQPLDPITENMNILNSIPVKAAIWQDHASHKLLHESFLAENPQLEPVIMAHMAEHTAYEYLLRMQLMLGYEMPPLEQLNDPQVQNTIAMEAANVQQQANEQQMQEGGMQAPIDPNAVVMADIQQKERDTQSKEEIAKLKAETDAFKSQLNFETEKAKIESNEDIAKLKSDTELAKNNV